MPTQEKKKEKNIKKNSIFIKMTEVSETMPADCMDGIDSCDDEDAAEIWGRLWPLGSSFNSFG